MLTKIRHPQCFKATTLDDIERNYTQLVGHLVYVESEQLMFYVLPFGKTAEMVQIPHQSIIDIFSALQKIIS